MPQRSCVSWREVGVSAILNGQPDDELVLEAVGFTIALNRVYFAIDLSNVHRISHRGGD